MLLLLGALCAMTASGLAPVQPAAALHLVIESQFEYMASTQASTVESWIADDRTYEKRGARVVINRKDRGLQWVIDTQKSTYSEARFATPVPRAAAPEDLRTAGFSYEPTFMWTVTDTAQTSTVNGKACRLTVVAGTADFAEMTLKFWLCQADSQGLEAKANGSVLEAARFRYQSPVTYATELLAKRPGTVMMSSGGNRGTADSAEARIYRVVIRTLESGPPPAGIFDLPPGIQKAP